MRSTARGSALVAFATCLAACAAEPTQLIVVVDTDLALGVQVDAVKVAVTGPTDATEEERVTVGAGDREILPLTLGISPSGDVLGPIDVVATAELEGGIVVARRHRVTLVRGESRMLLLHLTAACAARDAPCADGETCSERGCTAEAIEASSLPTWSGTAPRIDGDAGTSSMDASADAQRPDATTACGSAADCDDGNPCTDDTCRADGCAHTANTVACDDGFFCNGLDTCSGSACGSHAGAPCVGSTVCDETTDRCTGCMRDSDCPAETTSTFGACVFADGCDEAGTEARTITTFACEMGECVASERTEERACARDTDGTRCASRSCVDGACSGFAGACGTTGTRSQSCSEGVCEAGACATRTSTSMVACTRVTDGNVCSVAGCTAWSCGGFSGTCGESGTETRTCSDAASCSGGLCGTSRSRIETRACSRDTDTQSCGTPSCTLSACLGLGCSTSGTQTRTCTTPTCEAGICDSHTVSTSVACTRVTEGDACDDRQSCTFGDVCSGGRCQGSDSCGRDCFCDRNTCVPSGGGGSLCLIEAE